MCNIKVTLGNWSWLMAAESGLMSYQDILSPAFSCADFFSKRNSILQFPNCFKSMIWLSLLISSSLWCKDLSEWSWNCQVNATPLNYPREIASLTLCSSSHQRKGCLWKWVFKIYASPLCLYHTNSPDYVYFSKDLCKYKLYTWCCLRLLVNM